MADQKSEERSENTTSHPKRLERSKTNSSQQSKIPVQMKTSQMHHSIHKNSKLVEFKTERFDRRNGRVTKLAPKITARLKIQNTEDLGAPCFVQQRSKTHHSHLTRSIGSKRKSSCKNSRESLTSSTCCARGAQNLRHNANPGVSQSS